MAQAEGGADAGPQHMLLNGAALENLEVLENAEGGRQCMSARCVCMQALLHVGGWMRRHMRFCASVVSRMEAQENQTVGL